MGTSTETKPSIKTSEFWIHLALQIIFLLNTAGVYSWLPAHYSALVQAIIAAAYMGSRGLAKAGVPNNTNPPSGGIN